MSHTLDLPAQEGIVGLGVSHYVATGTPARTLLRVTPPAGQPFHLTPKEARSLAQHLVAVADLLEPK